MLIYDIHCHILPGVDDGARDEDSTERMMRIAADQGIKGIVATPHYATDMSEEHMQDIEEKYDKAYSLWKAISPEGEIYLGNELFWSEGLVQNLQEGKAFTMNATSYVLIEFQTYIDFRSMCRAVQTLVYAGYIPILAHIERYECLRKKEHVRELTEMGAFIQVNVSAVLGKHGLKTKMFVVELIKDSLVHFIGTDSHNSRDRSPEMEKCRFYLDKKFGVATRRQILEKNPARMLRGERLNE